MGWSKDTWRKEFPQHADLINRLPERVDRATALSFARDVYSPEAAVEAFIVAMIWGHGHTGYGPWRTARVLEGTAGAPKILFEASQRARAEGGPEAFAWLAENRLRRLGVAFATKYLFFCSYDSTYPAPILDRVVLRWLRTNVGWRIGLDWRVQEYSEYARTIRAWAGDLGIGVGDVEYLMFTDTEESRLDQRETADDTTTRQDVLSALEAAVESFTMLPDDDDLGDTEDFERGIRALRRIVLARTP
jgi:hypothetical protein